MEKYLLFSGSDFYPLGGWDDFKGYFDSVNEAKLALESIQRIIIGSSWAHIVHEDKIILWASDCENNVWEWRNEE